MWHHQQPNSYATSFLPQSNAQKLCPQLPPTPRPQGYRVRAAWLTNRCQASPKHCRPETLMALLETAPKLLRRTCQMCCVTMETELGVLQSSPIFLVNLLTETMIPQRELRMPGFCARALSSSPCLKASCS